MPGTMEASPINEETGLSVDCGRGSHDLVDGARSWVEVDSDRIEPDRSVRLPSEVQMAFHMQATSTYLPSG
jgi:hypothetical protein